MQKILDTWKSNKPEGSLLVCWLLTVFFSFWSDALISFSVPPVGEMFPFRVLLPLTAALYLVRMLRGNDRIWRDSTLLEKCVYGFIVILLVYSVASLPRAIDFAWTFRRLFNLCLDLCFFFLMLRLCRNENWLRYTLCAVGAAVALLCVMGVWEIFCGGIFNPYYDDLKRFTWFTAIYQYPVVSYGNTNDYASALLMCFCVLLLSLARRWRSCGKAARWGIVLSGALLYLLILASSARLVMVCFYIVLAGLTLFLLLADRKRLWIVLAALCLIGGIRFANEYRYLVPPLREYLAEWAKDRPDSAGRPSLHLGDPHKQTLDEQFYETDETTGEKTLRDTGSAGARAQLLLHSWNCFLESRGLGVGLGNTEQLAGIRKVAHNSDGIYYTNIHCFVARLIADYGVFALLPLCAIGILLLKAVLSALLQAIRRRERERTAYCLLLLFVLLTYPVVSTASSDAQDMLAMWIYLACVVHFTRELKERTSD